MTSCRSVAGDFPEFQHSKEAFADGRPATGGDASARVLKEQTTGVFQGNRPKWCALGKMCAISILQGRESLIINSSQLFLSRQCADAWILVTLTILRTPDEQAIKTAIV